MWSIKELGDEGLGEQRKQRSRGEIKYAQCPMPNAPCPMPHSRF
ncbi:hypothetical protein FDUTEX481_06042 [Tolypothrix sp. PCC 7601]|nr:hypothetical protein FDUTEX481_06042 [Tolypothrix sp. PCC 7601]